MTSKSNGSAKDFADSITTKAGRKEILAWAKRERKEYDELIKILEAMK